MNKKINFVIESYLQKHDTDYAYLINGPWGCGKTFYIQHEFKNIANKSGYRYIYLSLNGVDDDKIIKRILAFQLLYNKEDGSSFDSNVINNVIDLGSKLPTSLGGPLFDILGKAKSKTEDYLFEKIDFTKVVIIFDDLERISKKILYSNIIGSIFENYTKNGAKTIFVADETQIKDKDYFIRKEKIVRRSLIYNPDFDIQLESFIKHHFHNEKEITSNREFILKNLTKVGVRNLRTISFVLDNFLEVIRVFGEEDKYLPKEALFINIMILTEELKQGRLDDEASKKLPGIKDRFLLYDPNKKEEKDKSYEELFYDEYILKHKFDFNFINSILEFVLTGFFDETKLKTEVNEQFREPDPKEIALSTLTHCHEFEEKSLRESLDSLVDFLKKGQFNILKLPYIYTLLRYIQDQDYIEGWSIDVPKLMKESFAASIQNEKNIPEERTPYDRITRTTFDDRKSKEDDYKELIQAIDHKIANKHLKSKTKRVRDFFECLNEQIKFDWTMLNEFGNEKIFQAINETNSTHLFADLNNRGIYIIEQIIASDILRVLNAGEYGYEQKAALENIISYIEVNILKKDSSGMREKRFSELIGEMKKAIKHLEKTRSFK